VTKLSSGVEFELAWQLETRVVLGRRPGRRPRRRPVLRPAEAGPPARLLAERPRPAAPAAARPWTRRRRRRYRTAAKSGSRPRVCLVRGVTTWSTWGGSATSVRGLREFEAQLPAGPGPARPAEPLLLPSAGGPAVRPAMAAGGVPDRGSAGTAWGAVVGGHGVCSVAELREWVRRRDRKSPHSSTSGTVTRYYSSGCVETVEQEGRGAL